MLGKVAVAAAVFVSLTAPGAAGAVPPSCPPAKLTGPKDTLISLASLSCTNVGTDFQIIVDPFPTHGDLNGPPYTSTPDAGFHGTDQFKYTVTDNATHQTSTPATVDLLIDSAPVCMNMNVTTEANRAVRIPDLACTDVDDADFDIFFGDPAHGGADIDPATGDVVYTPAAGFAGTDSFTFYGLDMWDLDSPDSTVTITVSAPPPPPPVATIIPASKPAPPPDRTAPNAALKTAGKATLAKGVTLTLTSNEAGTAALTLIVDKATARKLKLDRKAKGAVTVGTGSAKLIAGIANSTTVKLTSKARKALKAARQVKLLLTAVVSDAAGNKATTTLVVTIKNPLSRSTTRG